VNVCNGCFNPWWINITLKSNKTYQITYAMTANAEGWGNTGLTKILKT
jgi:hypothetical protein